MFDRKEIQLTTPYYDDREIEAVTQVLRSGWVTQGPKVAEFEQAVANYVGAHHGIATTSCTTAMHLSLILRGIGEGDEVIMPSFPCPAAANAVRHSRAIPAFVDVDSRTFNLDPAAIANSITPRTRAIMAKHSWRVSPGRIIVRFGRPVTTTEYGEGDRDMIMARVLDEIGELRRTPPPQIEEAHVRHHQRSRS